MFISTQEQGTVSIIDKHLIGANKPKTTPVKQTRGSRNLTTLQHNLQDRERKTRRRRGHEETPIYTIPTIANGCLSTKDTFGPTILRNGIFNNNTESLPRCYYHHYRDLKEHTTQ
jgi:hypothetical protein